MKKILMMLLALAGLMAQAELTVTDVTARQRYPWNGLVDIVVTLQGTAEDVTDSECVFAATNSATQAVLPVKSVTQNGTDSGSDTTWTRRFIWDAVADVGAVKIDDVVLAVDVLGGVQLWENGPYWAKCNVGAAKPEEYGYYFQWGDTVGYKRNAANTRWVSVRDGAGFFTDNCPTYGKNNSQLRSAGYIDSTGNLVAAHDAARVYLGAPWRMPTDAEFSALVSNCDTSWTQRKGVWGRLVTGRGAYASKSIFLPAAGYGYGHNLYTSAGPDGHYWSSTPNSSDSGWAWNLYFNSGCFIQGDNSCRFVGMSIRPLRGFANDVKMFAVAGLTTHLTLDCQTGTRTPAAIETITYSTDWVGGVGEGATAVVAVDGTTLSEESGSGTVEWTPTHIGTYELTHKVMDGSVQVDDTLTAIFEVVSLPEGGPYKETVDGIEWTFMVTNGESRVGTGTGYAAIPETTKGAITVPSELGGRPVTGIGNNAFSSCTGLTGVTIPKGVKSIGATLFYLNDLIAELSIPASVTNVAEGAFYACFALQAIRVDDDNQHYVSPDDVLYTKDGTSLVCCPAAKTSVSLLDSVTNICSMAFGECRKLTSITLPPKLSTLGNLVFYSCPITELTFPSSVTRVGANIFPGCALKTVYFEGMPPTGVESARIENKTDAIRYNVAYETQWLPVIQQCGWTNAQPYTPSIEPGGEIVVSEGKAEEKAAEINSDPTVKAQYLKAPGGVETTADYLGCFSAVAASGSTVAFVLNEEGTNAVEAAMASAGTATLESALSKTGALVIDTPLVGFYYSLKQGGSVSVGDKADLNKLAGRDALEFSLTTDKSQYFYQTLVTPTPVQDE